MVLSGKRKSLCTSMLVAAAMYSDHEAAHSEQRMSTVSPPMPHAVKPAQVFTLQCGDEKDAPSDNLPDLGSPDDPLPASSINAFAHPNFKVPDSTIAKQMTVVGSAQVYFSRPRRSLFPNLVSPGKRELGSLFSPYWQARLVDTPCSTRHFTEVLYGPGVMPMPLPCLLH